MEIMQLNSCAQCPGLDPQRIPLRPSPCAPFDDYGETKRKKFLAELPLQCLDLAAPLFIVKVERKSIHPVIGTETNRTKPAFKRRRKCRFP